MYCQTCGTPLGPGLSYCNRCGVSLRERSEPTSTAQVSAFLTAITLIAVMGLGIMLGGALVLRKEAGFPYEMIGFFMLFTFLIVGVSEFMLIRNLSKLTSSSDKREFFQPPQSIPRELYAAHPPGEPVSSVTDSTTRTLEYSRRER
jgi:hypothetical protein